MISLTMALVLQVSGGGDYIQEANALGGDIFLAGACSGMEIISADRDEFMNLARELELRAVADGVSVDQIDEAFTAGVAERNQAFLALNDQIMEIEGTDRMARGLAIFRVECAPLFVKYASIVRPGARWDQ